MSQLWQKMQQVAECALQDGHLLSIDNSFERQPELGIDFVVRYAPQLQAKIRAGIDNKASDKPRNPFLPPEPELTVESIAPNHTLILNKFNVLPIHALLITEQFVEQSDQLMLTDFQAVSSLLAATDGLIFYNGGKAAGASQPHRHFQLVPQDFGNGSLPIQAAIDNCRHHERAQIFPFEHRLFWLPDYQPETLYDAWLKLEYAWQPYNLLITQQWMLVVPRKCESVQGISINSLAFAGGLLAKNAEERAIIKQTGCIELMRQVCLSE